MKRALGAILAKITSRCGFWSGRWTGRDLKAFHLLPARLRYAYATRCLRPAESGGAPLVCPAAKLDHDHETDAQQRTDELDGFLIDYDESDEVDSQSLHEPARDSPE